MGTAEVDAARWREIAHELNNALGLVINYAGLLAHEVRDQPQLADDVAEIRNAGRRAAELVKELSGMVRPDVASGP